jgi:hypothetical protein
MTNNVTLPVNKSFLDIYKKWAKKGKMTEIDGQTVSGLCDLFDTDKRNYSELFDLMKPTESDFFQLQLESKNIYCWASDSNEYKWFEFTPLRQNIVLLMAAMNNEL